MLGSHALKTWSSTQQVIATSSGEAELYALVKGAAQAKGICSILGDLNVVCAARVSTDATAAIGIVFRKGLGKMRHIDVQYLWLQEEVAERRLVMQKIATESNPADLFTKPLASQKIEKHLASMDFHTCNSRADSALKIV